MPKAGFISYDNNKSD